MENIKTNIFSEMSVAEMQKVDGGMGVMEATCAAVGLLGTAIYFGFQAGRAVARDVKKKF